MKNVKKILAILMALMLLSSAACGGKDDVAKHGVLEGIGMEAFHTGEHDEQMKKDNVNTDKPKERVNYGSLSSALMDLESGKIAYVVVEASTANYVAAHNDKIVAQNDKFEFSSCGPFKTGFSMMTMENNKEAYDILNNAIKAMKDDGTLASLIENELKAYINSDPEPKDLPHFDGAKTIKVGVTGDLPPMDYVAANGKAAGFNIALLTEIANRAQVNIELVQIETGARAMALSSGKVDAVFWTKNTECSKCGSVAAETIEGTLVTDSYFSDYAATISLKVKK